MQPLKQGQRLGAFQGNPSTKKQYRHDHEPFSPPAPTHAPFVVVDVVSPEAPGFEETGKLSVFHPRRPQASITPRTDLDR
jgi:hypothetical protein